MINDDDLSRIIAPVPDDFTQPSETLKTTFEPWHKPRKQHIRMYQWADAIVSRIIARRVAGDSKTLRYLSLPGNDLLDVREIRRVAVKNDITLKYIGFNSVRQGGSEDQALNRVENEIRGLDGVDDTSQIFRRRLESIVNDETGVYTQLRDNGPYDVINLDLCEHVFADAPGHGASYLDVLLTLADVQVQRGARHYLLFLTTRMEIGKVPVRVHSALSDILLRNAAADTVFSADLSARFCSSTESLQEALAGDAAGWPLQKLIDFFILGLGKWFCSALFQAFPHHLELLSAEAYRVYDHDPDMISLGFHCTAAPTIRIDPSELASGPHFGAPSIEEIDVAKTMLRNLSIARDLDELLENDPQAYAYALAETERLLQEARYDIEAYHRWLNGAA